MDIYHDIKVYVIMINSLFDLKETVAKYYCLGIYTIWLLAKKHYHYQCSEI